MGFRKATAKSAPNVLRKLADWLEEEDKDAQAWWADALNAWLNEAREQDAFGTEGQCDPRGRSDR